MCEQPCSLSIEISSVVYLTQTVSGTAAPIRSLYSVSRKMIWQSFCLSIHYSRSSFHFFFYLFFWPAQTQRLCLWFQVESQQVQHAARSHRSRLYFQFWLTSARQSRRRVHTLREPHRLRTVLSHFSCGPACWDKLQLSGKDSPCFVLFFLRLFFLPPSHPSTYILITPQSWGAPLSSGKTAA